MHLSHGQNRSIKLPLVAYLLSLLRSVAESDSVVERSNEPIDGGCYYVLGFLLFEGIHAFQSHQDAMNNPNTEGPYLFRR